MRFSEIGIGEVLWASFMGIWCFWTGLAMICWLGLWCGCWSFWLASSGISLVLRFGFQGHSMKYSDSALHQSPSRDSDRLVESVDR